MDPDFAKFYKETQDIVNETLMKEGGILVQEITGDDVSVLVTAYVFALRLFLCTMLFDYTDRVDTTLLVHT